MENNPKESEIQTNICEYLKVKGYFFWRSNNIPVFDSTKKSFRRMPKYAIKGIPDIFVLTDSETICLEVKRPKGSQWTYEQQVFCQKWESESAKRKYYVVRSLEDVIKIGL